MTRKLGHRKSTHDNSRKVGLAKQSQKLKIHSLMGAVYSIFQFLLEEKMEAIRQKLKEADNIPEVIDFILNLRIPNKGCKNIEDMKERMLTHLSSRTEVRLSGKLFNITNFYSAASIL